jgi:hypothetical protein
MNVTLYLVDKTNGGPPITIYHNNSGSPLTNNLRGDQIKNLNTFESHFDKDSRIMFTGIDISSSREKLRDLDNNEEDFILHIFSNNENPNDDPGEPINGGSSCNSKRKSSKRKSSKRKSSKRKSSKRKSSKRKSSRKIRGGMNSQERKQVRNVWLNKYDPNYLEPEPEPEPEPILSRNTSHPMEEKPNYNPNPELAASFNTLSDINPLQYLTDLGIMEKIQSNVSAEHIKAKENSDKLLEQYIKYSRGFWGSESGYINLFEKIIQTKREEFPFFFTRDQQRVEGKKIMKTSLFIEDEPRNRYFREKGIPAELEYKPSEEGIEVIQLLFEFDEIVARTFLQTACDLNLGEDMFYGDVNTIITLLTNLSGDDSNLNVEFIEAFRKNLSELKKENGSELLSFVNREKIIQQFLIVLLPTNTFTD